MPKMSFPAFEGNLALNSVYSFYRLKPRKVNILAEGHPAKKQRKRK